MKQFKFLSVLVCVFIASSAVLRAQDSHWSCNPSDYQYDMTLYLGLKIDDAMVEDLSKYEVAAFVGEECRGVSELQSKTMDDKEYLWYSLRARSNSVSGEELSFKVYDKERDREYKVQGTIAFASNATSGLPSSPTILETVRYTLGDVNGDGKINGTDVQLVINRMFKRTLPENFVEEAADVNGDGKINGTDVQLIVNIMFKR